MRRDIETVSGGLERLLAKELVYADDHDPRRWIQTAEGLALDSAAVAAAAPDPIQARARAAVRKAINSGELVKPAACEECGSKRSLDAHHDDYDKPVTVRWLCRSCHGTADEIRRAKDDVAAGTAQPWQQGLLGLPPVCVICGAELPNWRCRYCELHRRKR